MSIFIGIDQTGAVDKNGIAKPLPCAAIAKNKIHIFFLKGLNKDNQTDFFFFCEAISLRTQSIQIFSFTGF